MPTMHKPETSPKQFTFQEPSRVTVWGSLILFSVIILCLRIHTYHEPLERDLATYSVMAREMHHGRLLYSDLWDHKPPAIHLTYFLAQSIAGFGSGSVYLLGASAAIVTLFGIYFAASAGGMGNWVGLLAAAFWTATSSDLFLGANQPNSEVFINACLVWAFAFFLRTDERAPGSRCSILIGLLLALASLYKQLTVVNALAFAGVYFLYPSREKDLSVTIRKLTDLALMTFIGFIVWGFVFWYFSKSGRFQDFWNTVFVFNQSYSGNLSQNLLASLNPNLLMPRGMLAVIPLVLLTVLYFAVHDWKKPARACLFLAAYAIATQISIALPGKFYTHYYQLWLPVVAIGGAWAIAKLFECINLEQANLFRISGINVLAFLIFMQVPNFKMSADSWARAKTGYGDVFVESDRLGEILNQILLPNETFYEWGAETTLYFSSGRRPPTGIFYY